PIRALWRSLQQAGERERALGRALGRSLERTLGRVLELALEQALGQALGQELSQELERELDEELDNELNRVLDGVLDGAHQVLERELKRAHRVPGQTLERELDGALDGALDEALEGVDDEVLHGVLAWALRRVQDLLLHRARMASQHLAQRLKLESSIIRVLLWAWKRTSGTQPDHSDRRETFISSCRLWAPLETRVDFAINGIEWGVNGERLTFDDRNRDKLLTPDDLNGIVEFVEDLQKDMGKVEFIVRKADVEINRLCAHFNRRVDWNYDLYDLREPRTVCSRSTATEDGMI
ncbi:hypothetical protein M407DRAFT_27681, partial [Tulasnella calospora MUT 4182]